ncbi:hypothetical protein M885DRAFT_512027 [Pelagophyceae sp. CCMP2097]|nr:hypothetical protein M885DRAFT_512027 [Pelagophyceae sp. CCMP2097]
MDAMRLHLLAGACFLAAEGAEGTHLRGPLPRWLMASPGASSSAVAYLAGLLSGQGSLSGQATPAPATRRLFAAPRAASPAVIYGCGVLSGLVLALLGISAAAAVRRRRATPPPQPETVEARASPVEELQGVTDGDRAPGTGNPMLSKGGKGSKGKRADGSRDASQGSSPRGGSSQGGASPQASSVHGDVEDGVGSVLRRSFQTFQSFRGKLENLLRTSPRHSPVHKVERVGRICAELLATEKSYSTNLDMILSDFALKDLLPANDYESLSETAPGVLRLYAALQPLKQLADEMVRALEAAPDGEAVAVVAQTFLKTAPYFVLFAEYSKEYADAVAQLAILRQRTKAGAAFRAAEAKHSRTLESLLIAPVQRVCKYPMFLRDVVTEVQMQEAQMLSDASPQFKDETWSAGRATIRASFQTTLDAVRAADGAVAAVAALVNERVRSQIDISKTIEQYNLIGPDSVSKVPPLVPTRRLVDAVTLELQHFGIEGDGSLRSTKTQAKKYHVAVFNDLVVIMRPDRLGKGSWHVKDVFHPRDCRVEDFNAADFKKNAADFDKRLKDAPPPRCCADDASRPARVMLRVSKEGCADVAYVTAPDAAFHLRSQLRIAVQDAAQADEADAKTHLRSEQRRAQLSVRATSGGRPSGLPAGSDARKSVPRIPQVSPEKPNDAPARHGPFGGIRIPGAVAP